MNRIREALKIRSARKKGEAAGAEVGEQREADWGRFKEQAQSRLDDPDYVYHMFLGWMSGLHADTTKIFNLVEASEEESRLAWGRLALGFCGRFRAEVLEPRYDDSEGILSDAVIAEIVADIDGVISRLREAALDQDLAEVEATEPEAGGSLPTEPDSEQEELYFKQGRDLWRARASAHDIEKAFAAAPPEVEGNIRSGMHHELSEELVEQKGTPPVLVEMMNAGPGMDRRLRLLFSDEKGFQDFKRFLADERVLVVQEDRVKSSVRLALIGLAGAVIGAAIFGLGSLAIVYAFYVAGTLLGAALVPRANREISVDGGVAWPLVAVLTIPLVLGAVVLTAVVLLAQMGQ